MRISDLSSDVCSSDLTRRWSAGQRCSRGKTCQTGSWRSFPFDRMVANTILRKRISGALVRSTFIRRIAPCQDARKKSASSSGGNSDRNARSEEHTSELQSLMRISYAVFCLKNKNILITQIY